MFIAVRKYRVRRGASAEWAQRVRDGFVPLMREMTGFRGYYLLDGGPDVLIAISMFDSADVPHGAGGSRLRPTRDKGGYRA